MKTLRDPRVREALSKYVLVTHNQLPELYCNNTVDARSFGQRNFGAADGRRGLFSDPPIRRGSEAPKLQYPDDQVDRCPEGAGGGNVRLYLCAPGGQVRRMLLGYWKPERLLEELRHFDLEPSEHEKLHRTTAHDRLLLRSIREVREGDIEEELRRVEDEIYTKGRIG